MRPFQKHVHVKETLFVVVFLCLSQFVVSHANSARTRVKQVTRRNSWMLNNISHGSDRSAAAASGATTSSLEGSGGKWKDKDRQRREGQRSMTSHQVYASAAYGHHQGQFHQQQKQYQQQQLQHSATHGEMRQPRQISPSSSVSFCSLLPQDPAIPRLLRALSQGGDTHLIEYSITFPEYPTNPLKLDWTITSRPNVTRTYIYQEARWQRVLSSEGKTLLMIAFNYDALSLGLLRYGVKKMTVPLLDSPPKCFAAQNASQRMALTLNLLLRDFEEDGGSASNVGSDSLTDFEKDLWKHASNFVCHQIVQDNGGFSKFAHECCTLRHVAYSNKLRTACVITSADHVVTFLNILLVSLSVLFFLFGPLLLQKLLFSGSTGRTEYVVPIEPDLWKTILIRRVPCEDSSSPAKRKEMRQFVRFRELVKNLKSEKIMRVTFSRLDITVDNQELMSEDEVPVGLLRFLLDAFVRCRVTRVEPFRTCCAESVIGSWSPFFLWFRLKRHASDCNRGCKEICAWTSIFRCLGGLLLMVVLLLPCYVRLAIFYWFEKEEMEARNNARSQLGLRYRPGGLDVFQWLIAGHSLVLSIHAVFYISYLLLFIIRAVDPSRIDDVILRSITDMRKLQRKECLRMLCAHIVLPFEKFGLCGALVAAFYWPLALPFCFLVAAVYCIPTLYLIGRLLVSSRPKCLEMKPFPSPPAEQDPQNNRNLLLLSEGTTSFSSCFLLDRISVDRSPSPAKVNFSTQTTHPPSSSHCPSRESATKAIASILVALCLIVCILAILAMYSETLGFYVEMGFFSALGAILNAKHSICNVILVFWAWVYIVIPYRIVYARYAELSRCMFRLLKDQLSERIESASLLRHEKQKNTAFKFLDAPPATVSRSSTTNADQDARLAKAGSHGEDEKTAEAGTGFIRRKPATNQSADETIEYRDDKLHWKIRSLVMFVDRKDKPRIPRELFWRICELDLMGSPGPVRRAMAVATGQVLASLLFLLLLYIVVLVSGEMQPTSGVLQALIVFSLGSAPAVVAFVFPGQSSRQRLNEYSLTGHISRTILEHYEHAWPVQDLRFSEFKDIEEPKDGRTDGEPMHLPAESCSQKISCQRSAHRDRASYDPSQVDLLITIREEDELRQGDERPCAQTSAGSSSSDVFRNPAAEDSTQSLPLRLLGKRATRCTSDPTADSYHPNVLLPGLSSLDITAQKGGPVDREYQV